MFQFLTTALILSALSLPGGNYAAPMEVVPEQSSREVSVMAPEDSVVITPTILAPPSVEVLVTNQNGEIMMGECIEAFLDGTAIGIFYTDTAGAVFLDKETIESVSVVHPAQVLSVVTPNDEVLEVSFQRHYDNSEIVTVVVVLDE